MFFEVNDNFLWEQQMFELYIIFFFLWVLIYFENVYKFYLFYNDYIFCQYGCQCGKGINMGGYWSVIYF